MTVQFRPDKQIELVDGESSPLALDLVRKAFLIGHLNDRKMRVAEYEALLAAAPYLHLRATVKEAFVQAVLEFGLKE